LRLNPRLAATESPPIPAAKLWCSAYGGAAGPLIDLSQAVPGYPPHPELLARLGHAAATTEASAYGDIAGDPALRAAYAEHVAATYGAEIAAEHVAITAGCNQGFFVAVLALARAGEAVMLATPWYFNHKMALDMLGIDAVPLPCRAERGFIPDPEEAGALLRPDVRAIALVTPNNPTGAIYPAETIAAFHALCAERGIPLIIDETYRDFLPLDGGGPHSALSSPGWEETIVQLYSFSKSYCIPGHRVGAMVAGRHFIDGIGKILDTLQICAPRTAQLVLPSAISALAEWRAANQVEIAGRAAAFRAAMASLDGWALRSLGAYFGYVEHPFGAVPGEDVAERLAGRHGVLALPGSFFGPGQDRYLRVAFANVGAAVIGTLPDRLRPATTEPLERSGSLGEDLWTSKRI